MLFLQDWKEKMQFGSDDVGVVDGAASLVIFVAESQGFSFRTVERILANLAIIVATTPKNYMRTPTLLAGLCVLKVKFPALYVKAKLGTLTYQEVSVALALNLPDRQDEFSATVETARGWWGYCLGTAENQGYQGALMNYRIFRREDVVPMLANQVVDWWDSRD
jgi:hypothetical protein